MEGSSGGVEPGRVNFLDLGRIRWYTTDDPSVEEDIMTRRFLY